MTRSVGPADDIATATARGARPDLISLRDHVIEIEIGAFQQERDRRQRVRFTVVAELARFVDARMSDDVDSILSYDVLLQSIEDELAIGRLDLLETLAEGIAARILSTDRVGRVHVRIEKLDRSSGALGIEIVRDRADNIPTQGDPTTAISARVVFLDHAMIGHPRLGDALDRLASEGGAVICVDAGTTMPIAQAERAQWRIDLLGIEQSAWLLAGRDARCVVVATRTELDWGLRNRQISVWAPSKLVLDTKPGPTPGADAREIAHWLARLVGAPRLETLDFA